MKFQVLVRLKPGVLDVQGKAIEHGLGVAEISEVRVGRLIELEVEAADEKSARMIIETACSKVLVNPIIEFAEIRGIK
jgi:phosphoribosylformylglycinamidine synthase PurS subunit